MRKFNVAFAIGICLWALPTFATDGRETGNGGDPVAIEFFNEAMTAIRRVRENGNSFPELANTNLAGILDSTKVLVVDHELQVAKSGVQQKSAAVNFTAPNRILVSRGAWSSIASAQMKQSLALHELVSLVGLEETGKYGIAGRYEQIASQPEYFPHIDKFWNFRRPSESEQKMFLPLVPAMAEFAPAKRIKGVSQAIRMPFVVNRQHVELAIQVIYYELDYADGEDDEEFYQLIAFNSAGSVVAKDLVFGDPEFRVVRGGWGEFLVYHFAADEKGTAGYEISQPMNANYKKYHLGFWNLPKENVVSAVPLQESYEMLVLGKPDDGPYGLYYAHLSGRPRLVKSLPQIVPSLERSTHEGEKRPMAQAILGVYKNDRGVFALVNELEGITAVNIATGEAKAIYEVPESNYLAYAFRARRPIEGLACLQMDVAIYKNEKQDFPFSDNFRSRDGAAILPGNPSHDPAYVLRLGVYANKNYFELDRIGCELPKVRSDEDD